MISWTFVALTIVRSFVVRKYLVRMEGSYVKSWKIALILVAAVSLERLGRSVLMSRAFALCFRRCDFWCFFVMTEPYKVASIALSGRTHKYRCHRRFHTHNPRCCRYCRSYGCSSDLAWNLRRNCRMPRPGMVHGSRGMSLCWSYHRSTNHLFSVRNNCYPFCGECYIRCRLRQFLARTATVCPKRRKMKASIFYQNCFHMA